MFLERLVSTRALCKYKSRCAYCRLHWVQLTASRPHTSQLTLTNLTRTPHAHTLNTLVLTCYVYIHTYIYIHHTYKYTHKGVQTQYSNTRVRQHWIYFFLYQVTLYKYIKICNPTLKKYYEIWFQNHKKHSLVWFFGKPVV